MIGKKATFLAAVLVGSLAAASAADITNPVTTASQLSNGVTGSGAIVLATNAALTTPTIGAATATSVAFSTSGLFQDSANNLSLRNGTNAQFLRVFNTYTDNSNNEFVELGYSANTAYIAVIANGTGTARPLDFNVGGGDRWQITTSGNFVTVADNALDIGGAAANRPRDLNLGRNAVIPGTISVTGLATLGAVTMLGNASINVNNGSATTNVCNGTTTGNCNIGGTGNVVTMIGHLNATGGSAASISGTGCAAGTPTPTDTRGTITATTATACTVTFASTFSTTPVCVVTDSSNTLPTSVSAISATAVTFTSAALTGSIYYICMK